MVLLFSRARFSAAGGWLPRTARHRGRRPRMRAGGSMPCSEGCAARLNDGGFDGGLRGAAQLGEETLLIGVRIASSSTRLR